jgi:hypothetical protein
MTAYRKTSIEAFTACREMGVLNGMQWRAYEYLYHQGPMTGSELDQALMPEGRARGHYHKRLSELEKLGVAQRVGTRPCKVTGRNADLWDVTDAKPPASAPKVTRLKHHTMKKPAPLAPPTALTAQEVYNGLLVLRPALNAVMFDMARRQDPGTAAASKLLERLFELAENGEGL